MQVICKKNINFDIIIVMNSVLPLCLTLQNLPRSNTLHGWHPPWPGTSLLCFAFAPNKTETKGKNNLFSLGNLVYAFWMLSVVVAAAAKVAFLLPAIIQKDREKRPTKTKTAL